MRATRLVIPTYRQLVDDPCSCATGSPLPPRPGLTGHLRLQHTSALSLAIVRAHPGRHAPPVDDSVTDFYSVAWHVDRPQRSQVVLGNHLTSVLSRCACAPRSLLIPTQCIDDPGSSAARSPPPAPARARGSPSASTHICTEQLCVRTQAGNPHRPSSLTAHVVFASRSPPAPSAPARGSPSAFSIQLH